MLAVKMTKNIRQVADFEERAKRLESVRQEYIFFRDRLKKDLKLKEKDGRFVFLRNIISLTRTTVVYLHLFDRCAKDETFAMSIFGLTDPASIGPQIRNSNKFLKLSWCILFQFQLENLFQNILKSSKINFKDGFWNISEDILKNLGISNRKYLHKKLQVLAYIRNSLHNNGTYINKQGKSQIIQVDKIRYRFNHNKVIRCANWDYIAHVWLNLLPILEQIHYNRKVTGVSFVAVSYIK